MSKLEVVGAWKRVKIQVHNHNGRVIELFNTGVTSQLGVVFSYGCCKAGENFNVV